MLAVINQLAANHDPLEIRFWCDRGYRTQAAALMGEASIKVNVSTVFAGKLRRYHGSSWLEKLLDIQTIIHNILDIFLVILGFLQSLIKLIIWRPKVVFLKGGFVCLPVGYAAYLLRIPIVIHDSDAHAGLANRLLAPVATTIATGAPLEYYNYPKQKAHYVGIPVKSTLRPLTNTQKAEIKEKFHLPADQPLVVVTGGGLGAKRINNAVVAIASKLARVASVVHLSGAAQYKELQQKVPQSDNYKLISFISEGFTDLVGAADIVISRAGASSLAELAAVGANVILVPNPQLVGGHQLKNAQIYVDKGAVVIADETKFEADSNLLLNQITELLDNIEKRHQLGAALHTFAKPHAAADLAKLITRAANL